MARRSTDTLVASGDFNFTLGAVSLSISSVALVAFTVIEKARLTGGNSANTIDASLLPVRSSCSASTAPTSSRER
jgi:hypothetical protein